MEILTRHGVAFSSFDVFSDEEVRQELKTFSQWPTYPQLYVAGELIGGLDIVKVNKFHFLPFLLCQKWGFLAFFLGFFCVFSTSFFCFFSS